MKIKSISNYLLLSIVVTSCGPLYDTRYDFVPPESSSGRACVYQCENSKSSCLQLAEYRKRDCEDRADYEYERCQDDIARRGKKEKWYDCFRDSCEDGSDRCNEQYLSCYRSCGGDVKVSQVCIANCDQIPPKNKK